MPRGRFAFRGHDVRAQADLCPKKGLGPEGEVPGRIERKEIMTNTLYLYVSSVVPSLWQPAGRAPIINAAPFCRLNHSFAAGC